MEDCLFLLQMVGRKEIRFGKICLFFLENKRMGEVYGKNRSIDRHFGQNGVWRIDRIQKPRGKKCSEANG